MCQCPERGDLHFYRSGKRVVFAKEKMCQCPERGDLHFYIWWYSGEKESEWKCQCPERGDLHFYPKKPVVTTKTDDVSMP